MKFRLIIIIFGALAALLFFASMYAFLFAGGYFKPVAFSFLVVTVIMFVLVIVRNIIHEEVFRRKPYDWRDDPSLKERSRKEKKDAESK